MPAKVMNCEEWAAERFVPGAVSPKFDGIRGFYAPGETFLYTRNNEPVYGCGHIVEAFKDIKYDHESDMELYIDGMEFNKLSGVIRSYDDCPEVQAMIIDTPSHKGTLIERLQARPAHLIQPCLHRIPHYRVSDVKALYGRYEQFVDFCEGLVFKSLDHLYTNCRSWDWMRMVPIKSQDCEMLGVYEGTGKFKNMAGGITVMWWNPVSATFHPTNIGTMKGITVADRIDMFTNRDNYIGRTAQINFKDYQKSGKPRQPRFTTWRFDK